MSRAVLTAVPIAMLTAILIGVPRNYNTYCNSYCLLAAIQIAVVTAMLACLEQQLGT